jgi:hypothetical protein
LLWPDRSPKFPIERIADATRGVRRPRFPTKPGDEETQEAEAQAIQDEHRKKADRGEPESQHAGAAP